MVGPATSREVRSVDRFAVQHAIPLALLTVAALGWWWSVRMADEMRADNGGMMDMSSGSAMGATAFMVAWLAMMAAMMLPAISPVAKLYARAAGLHRVAPVPCFVAGYLAVWMLLGVPAYVAWRALDEPLAEGAAWAGRVAGAVFVVAGVWQVTPLKNVCLSHCRSPLSFFLRYGGQIERPVGAARMGASHGLFCVGCCWTMFALLVAIGTMNIGWMLLLTALIFVEKARPRGEQVAKAAGATFVVLGTVLLLSPGAIDTIT